MADPAAAGPKITGVGLSHKSPQVEDGVRFRLQPIAGVHLDARPYQMAAVDLGDLKSVYLFSVIAAFVLLVACINFMNLATARAGLRAKEVGLRKVFGAERRQLIRQFLGESLFLSLVGMLFGVLLVVTVLPAFNAFAQKEFTAAELFSPPILAGLGLIILLTGFGAGIFPAFVLSSFEPVRTIRGKLGSGTQGQTLRKGLVIVQFSIAVFMIIGIIVVVRQIEYLKNKDLGFNREMLLVVPARGARNDAIKNRILLNPNVKSVSFDLAIPGQFTPDDTFVPEGRNQDETFRTSSFTVGYDFLKTYEIDLLWGRDFSPEFPTDAQEGLIINETAARQRGSSFRSPASSSRPSFWPTSSLGPWHSIS